MPAEKTAKKSTRKKAKKKDGRRNNGGRRPNTGGARPGAGRKPYKPTDEQRKQVETLSGLGLPVEQIAALVGVTQDCLYTHFRQHMIEGKAKANIDISRNLFLAAKNGCATRQIFWAKTQMRWRDQTRVEHTGPDGGPMQFTEIRSIIVDPKKLEGDEL